MKCERHNTVMTYRAGKENELFCKACERKHSKYVLVKEKKWYQKLMFWRK